MSEKPQLNDEVRKGSRSRAWIRAKLKVLIASQIKALRLRKEWSQKELAEAANLRQSQISAYESIGGANYTTETLCKVADAFKCGVKIEFVSLQRLLDWENQYSQDTFNVDDLAAPPQPSAPRYLGHSENVPIFSDMLSASAEPSELTTAQATEIGDSRSVRVTTGKGNVISTAYPAPDGQREEAERAEFWKLFHELWGMWHDGVSYSQSVKDKWGRLLHLGKEGRAALRASGKGEV